MNEQKRIGQLKYKWWFKISRVAFLVPLCLTTFSLFHTDNILSFISATIPLIASILLLYLVLKYFTFSIHIDDRNIYVEYFKMRKRILLRDIVYVEIKGEGLFEYVYMRDRAGNKLSLEKGLEHYQEVKGFLLEIEKANTYEEDEKKVFGRHEYSQMFKIIVIAITALVWALFIKVLPASVLKGEINLANDFVAISEAFVLFVFGTVLSLLAMSCMTFSLVISQHRIQAKSFGKEKNILFNNITKVKVDEGNPFGMVYIIDNMGTKITFERFLENYENIKRYLLRVKNGEQH